MDGSRTYFEQIPIEAVKRIAQEFFEKDAVGRTGENFETRAEVRPGSERWREIALKVQQEHDPQRVIELTEQLVSALDEERLRRPSICSPPSVNPSRFESK